MNNLHLLFSILFLAIFSCKKEEVEPDPIVNTPIIESPIVPGDTTTTVDPPADYFLTINITDIRDIEGEMNIAIFDNSTDFDAKTNWVIATEQTVTGSPMQVKIKNLPAGEYAISVYHDKNNDGELNTNFLGIPKEGFGFSNDAINNFGPPSFDQAKITIAAADQATSIDLVHY